MRLKNDSGELLTCPLTGSGDLELVETIGIEDLLRVWHGGFGVDLSEEFLGLSSIYLLRGVESDLTFFYPPISGSETFYEALSALPWYHDEKRFEFGYAAGLIRPGERVLEVGSGTGAFAGFLPEGVSYTGLEFHPRAVAECRDRGLAVEQRSIEEEAAHSPGGYDVLCTFQVLEHVTAPGAFLKACIAAVRPGGRIILSVPSADSFLRHNTNDVLNLPPHHLTWWSDRCLQGLEAHFPLRLLDLRHTTLTEDGDRSLFLKVLIGTALFKARHGKAPGLINLSPEYLGLRPEIFEMCRLLEPGFVSPRMEPTGKTVVAVYEVTDEA
jgi:SAM-dependent methyltransferase